MGAGRKSGFDPKLHLDWGMSLAKDGATDKEIARVFGISRATLCDWKNRFPEFSDALKKGKEPIDAAVECALLKRALGFQYTKTKVREIRNTAGVVVNIETTHETMMVLPDVLACRVWLTNRRPEKWRNSPLESESKLPEPLGPNGTYWDSADRTFGFIGREKETGNIQSEQK